MKYIILVLAMAIGFSNTFGQSVPASGSITVFEFGYDDAGNQKARYLIEFKSDSTQNDTTPPFVTVDSTLNRGMGANGNRDYDNLNEVDAGILQVKIYPNPTKGKVYVQFAGLRNGNAIVSVLNVAGQQIASAVINNSICTVDISNSPVGIYILEIRYAGVLKQWKLLKD